ncbi:uncharacterized protein LOC127794360 [Diospyros lotus]|uniref:uncharacterized protein LOC127794360 n=1 Tax=Diospyros lotus TaxID=55363 RepID=UPI0022579261|nr:uncharacterized protein LOC127794360 [Diospyros lotus]
MRCPALRFGLAGLYRLCIYVHVDALSKYTGTHVITVSFHALSAKHANFAIRQYKSSHSLVSSQSIGFRHRRNPSCKLTEGESQEDVNGVLWFLRLKFRFSDNLALHGDMDEQLEDFVADCSDDASEVDSCYEFDAARFFDFTRPESPSEAHEADRWFDYSGNYSPSPFILKLKWREDIRVETTNSSLCSNDGESMISSGGNLDSDMDSEGGVSYDNKNGPKSCNDMAYGIPKMKRNSMAMSSKIRSSTFMKPTASHLAKLNGASEVYSCQFSGRCQRPLTKMDGRSSRSPHEVGSCATKRQKLENGYLSKVARLKHQSLLLHKLSKQVRQFDASTFSSKSKVTIPRGPHLETAQRAQKHRSRSSSDSGEHAKSVAPTLKSRPLNRKILKVPPPLQKKNRARSPLSQVNCQVFHSKTSERAKQHSSTNAVNIQNPESISENGTKDVGRQEKYEMRKRVQACRPLVKRDLKLPNDNRASYSPPIELFNKLSLKSEFEGDVISHPRPPQRSKGSKENLPASFNPGLKKSGRT